MADSVNFECGDIYEIYNDLIRWSFEIPNSSNYQRLEKLEQTTQKKSSKMEIDYEKIKSYLNTFLKCEQPMINTLDLISKLGLDKDNQDEFAQFWYYLNLLNDANYIDCIGDKENNLGISFSANGEPIVSVRNFRLSLSGNQALEVMKTNKIWSRIKGNLKVLGVEGVKQIPSLAIRLIENNG